MQTLKRQPISVVDQAGGNKRPLDCSNHRLSMTSCEMKYSTSHEYGEPVETIYTFRCSGSCGMTATLTVKH